MKLNFNILLGAGALWLGSLICSYYFGHRHGVNDPSSIGSQAVKSASEATSQRPGKSGVANSSSGKTAETEQLSLKQILGKFKALCRTSGGLQNPRSMMKLMMMLETIRPEDLQSALAEAETMTDPQGKMLIYMTLLGKWAETDGPAAIRYAEEHSKSMGMLGQMAKMSVVAAWSENEPEAVWKWYNENKEAAEGNGMGGNVLLMSLFGSMAARDPELAFRRLAEIDGPGKQMALMGMFQSSLFDDNKRAALMKQVEALPDKDERKQAQDSMLSQLAMFAPEQAIEYVRSQPTEEQSAMRATVATMLMMSEPKKAAGLMLEGASAEELPGRYERVINSWAFQDLNAAGTWLNEQPKGPHLDQAKRSFVLAASTKDPGSAMVWATTITEPTIRESSTSVVYDTWKKKDPTAADQALNNSGLPPDAIEKIRTNPNR